MNAPPIRRVLRTKDSAEKLGVDRVSIWRWSQSGHLPQPFMLGPDTPAWFDDEIDAFLEGRRDVGATECK